MVCKSHHKWSYPKHIENVHLLVSLKGEDGLPGPKGAKGIPGDPVSKSKNIANTWKIMIQKWV